MKQPKINFHASLPATERPALDIYGRFQVRTFLVGRFYFLLQRKDIFEVGWFLKVISINKVFLVTEDVTVSL